jgi:hypothetical protein
MKFDEILRHETLKYPFIQDNNITFRDYFNVKLDEYIGLLSKLDDIPIKIPGIKSSKETILRRQDDFISGLRETINFYLDGRPNTAYSKLSETLQNRVSSYSGLLSVTNYDKNADFYRIRKGNHNNEIIAENFFHIPFEYRGKVSSQRFSIPGFPSLYLGRTVYICWEELNRPNINEFSSLRLNSKVSINYIDLAPPYFEHNLFKAKYYKYLMIWPLIFACTIKVKNIDDYFKPEYIIPQLLLEWIRNVKRIDGIRYWSTHVKENPLTFKGEFYNLVLPVKKNKDTGLCDNLCNKFEATEIVSWQSLEFATSGANFIATNKNKVIDSKMEHLELIKGRKYPYSYSVFGKMEQYLSELETRELINS